MIPPFLDRIKEVDPKAVVDWSSEEGSHVFSRAFICPFATMDALKHCQSVICLDAYHTKNKKYPMQLFMATTLDGNMSVVILCYAIAPIENSDNWTWFMEMLKKPIHDVGDCTIPFISDCYKGLLATMRDVSSEKVHGHYATT